MSLAKSRDPNQGIVKEKIRQNQSVNWQRLKLKAIKKSAVAVDISVMIKKSMFGAIIISF